MWFMGGQVGIYEISGSTSLEVAIAAHPIATRIDGRVVEARLELGRRVKIGEVLVELDAEAERLALARSEARLASFKAQAVALRPEIEAREAGLAAYSGAKTLLVAESRANTEEAMAQTRFAESQAATRRMLVSRNFVSREVLHEAETKAEAGHAAVRARKANTGRMKREAEVEIADRRAEIAELQRRLADLEGRATAEEVEARAIQQRIDAHFIRAAIDGYLGRVEIVRVGTVVQAGQVLGTVVPDGEPHAVAWFGSSAVGRIRPHQSARLRLDGFPWTQYGTLAATVDSVGNDPLGDRVRVELVLRPESTPFIPLVHGLSGTTEIEVERISPARLVLRAVGRWLTTRTAKAAKTTGPNLSPGKSISHTGNR